MLSFRSVFVFLFKSSARQSTLAENMGQAQPSESSYHNHPQRRVKPRLHHNVAINKSRAFGNPISPIINANSQQNNACPEYKQHIQYNIDIVLKTKDISCIEFNYIQH